jgi:hypothetical protein
VFITVATIDNRALRAWLVEKKGNPFRFDELSQLLQTLDISAADGLTLELIKRYMVYCSENWDRRKYVAQPYQCP